MAIKNKILYYLLNINMYVEINNNTRIISFFFVFNSVHSDSMPVSPSRVFNNLPKRKMINYGWRERLKISGKKTERIKLY